MTMRMCMCIYIIIYACMSVLYYSYARSNSRIVIIIIYQIVWIQRCSSPTNIINNYNICFMFLFLRYIDVYHVYVIAERLSAQ